LTKLADKNPAQNQAHTQFQGILIALGANLIGPHGEPPAQTVRAAAKAVGQLFEGLGYKISRFYSSAPVPVSDQPRFINAVLRVDIGNHFAPDPASILANLHEIEAQFGRMRSIRNAARTLDLDLIACGDLVINSPTLTLPHPRAHQRLFVLLPLRDVAPEWRHPVSRVLVSGLIEALPPADIRVED